jgi:hypothetical protein
LNLSNWKLYVVIFILGIAAGVGLTYNKVEKIDTKNVNQTVTATQAIQKPNGEMVYTNPRVVYQSVTVSKIIPVITSGPMFGGGYDLIQKRPTVALGYELGNGWPIVTASSDFSGIQLNAFFHF